MLARKCVRDAERLERTAAATATTPQQLKDRFHAV
jgi:hypothetical protein